MGKIKKSKDEFFNIDGENCLLASFFVKEEFRGKNIYPNLIRKIITDVYELKRIYKYCIAIFEYNKSSLRGVDKLGFKINCRNNFKRFCKVTLNKYYIH